MTTEKCHDRLRVRLGDASGVLRIEEFTIQNAAECQGMEHTLREYLVGRPLAEVDLDYLRRLRCPADGECLRAMIDEVQKYQHLFSGRVGNSSASC